MFDTPPRDLAVDLIVSTGAATQCSDSATLVGAPGGAPADEALERGTVVGRYVVIGKLGAGGMGVVYAAYDPELDRKVAVKLLRAGVGASVDARTRLLREAQALARLAHPNVVAVHDTGSVGERVWLAMEFIDGQTLAAWCAAQPQRRSRWREVLAVMMRAGRGLQAAHAAGLVHRDFKPKPSRLPPKAPLPRNAVDLQQSGLLRGRRSGQGWSGVVRMAQTWPKSWARSRPSTVPPGVVVRDDARPSLEPLAVEPAHDLSSPIAGIWRAAGSRSPAPRAAPATPAQRRRRRPASSGWRTSSPRRRTCPSNPAGTRGSLGRHGFSCS